MKNFTYEKIYFCLHVSHGHDFLPTARGNYTQRASCRAQGKLHFFTLLSVDYDFAGFLCQCLTVLQLPKILLRAAEYSCNVTQCGQE